MVVHKVGAVIAYKTMHSLMAHLDIFYKSKDKYEQVPLILIDRKMGNKINELYKKDISINFKTNTITTK